MTKVKVITDSTVDLPIKYQLDLSVDVIPLHIIWGEERFLDNVNLTPEEFYLRLSQSKVMPTTSQPSVQEFVDLFKKYLEEKQDILSIHISSGLSGTVNSAQQAKEILKADNIEVVDSKFTSLGTGFQVIAAANAAKNRANLMECKSIAHKVRETTHIYFVVSTLEFLRRGGRIGGASALLGSALNIKPILFIKDGKIEAFEKVRTMKKALIRIADIFEEEMKNQRPLYVGFSQATSPEFAEILKKEVLKRFPSNDFIEIVDAGLSPVIGVHAGPGALALSFANAI